MTSLIEKLKFWKAKAQDPKTDAYSAAEELLDIALNDPSAKAFGIDAETAVLMRREILNSVREALSSENSIEAVRNFHGNLVGTVAAFGVLVVEPESSMFAGITGELRNEIPRLIEVDEDLQSFFQQLPDRVTTHDEMIGMITFHAFAQGIWLKAFEAARIALGDSFKEREKDWGMPYLISQQIFCEWVYRKKLHLPSNIPDDLEGRPTNTGIMKAKLHSLWPEIIANGHKDPRAVWEAKWLSTTRTQSPFYGKAL